MRIGYGLGATTAAPPADGPGGGFGELVDALEATGWDSLWCSERLTGPAPDPLVALAYVAGRTTRLKLGTSVLVLPGRNPVVLAKAIASLDVLSGGRMLPAVGLGAVNPREQQAFGVAREACAAWFEEALPLMRRIWAQERVEHAGERFELDGVGVEPKPVQASLDVWLGGRAPGELRRTGRLGDGWLASFCTPAEAAAGRAVVEEAAAGAGRSIDPEHFGALVPYAAAPLADGVKARLAAVRPDGDIDAVVPVGLDAAASAPRVLRRPRHLQARRRPARAALGAARRRARRRPARPAAGRRLTAPRACRGRISR